MKKVILKEKTEEVYLSDLNDDSIVGIDWDGLKHFVINTKDGFCATDNLNTSDRWNAETLKEYISKIENQKVFVFENQKELFKWLSE